LPDPYIQSESVQSAVWNPVKAPEGYTGDFSSIPNFVSDFYEKKILIKSGDCYIL
jgi:hypothetical protein